MLMELNKISISQRVKAGSCQLQRSHRRKVFLYKRRIPIKWLSHSSLLNSPHLPCNNMKVIMLCIRQNLLTYLVMLDFVGCVLLLLLQMRDELILRKCVLSICACCGSHQFPCHRLVHMLWYVFVSHVTYYGRSIIHRLWVLVRTASPGKQWSYLLSKHLFCSNIHM